MVKLRITQVKRGPILQLLVAAIKYTYNNADNSAISDTFEINDMAKVRLQVSLDQSRKNMLISISTRKHELAGTASIRTNVSCAALKYSQKRICSENWSDWVVMGTVMNIETDQPIQNCSYCRGNFRVVVTMTDICISVQKTNISLFNFSMLYEDLDLTDFQLSTLDGSVAIHKAVLAVHSDMFKTMFTGEWKETNENNVQIKDFSLQTLQHLKTFVYLGTLPDDGLRPLLALAKLYSINYLKNDCVQKLAETVTPEDLYSLHEFACDHKIPELTRAITELTPSDVIEKARLINKNEAESKKPIETKQT